jgi:two-component sensor histidine kinase
MAALRLSEGDKATLLADADHRIKNNLQLMASLLQLESMQADGGRELLQAAASRMAIMGRVHEMPSHAIGREVHARPFIEGLCADLARSLSDGKQVKVEVAAEDVVLAGRTATMLGLLINELVTNTIKHAFLGGALGSVKVALSREDERVRLVVADDGVGLGGARSASAAVLRTSSRRTQAATFTPKVTAGRSSRSDFQTWKERIRSPRPSPRQRRRPPL